MTNMTDYPSENKDHYFYFNNSIIDKQRTVSRAQIFSYAKNATFPILFRHYVHPHSSVGTYNYSTLRAQHGICSMFIAVDVSFNFITTNNVYSPGCGEIITIQNDCPFDSYFYGSQTLNYYQIDFPCEFFTLVPSPEFFSKVFYDMRGGDLNSITMNHEELTSMFTILCDIEEIIAQNSPYKNTLLYSQLIILFNKINSVFHSSKALPGGHSLPPSLKNAVRYISEHYLTIESTTEVAAYCHISVSYLCRAFKSVLNVSPVEYINSLRLSYAKYLLQNGHNVTEACYRAGFNSYNYFITTFKAKIGKTPTEYARQAHT